MLDEEKFAHSTYLTFTIPVAICRGSVLRDQTNKINLQKKAPSSLRRLIFFCSDFFQQKKHLKEVMCREQFFELVGTSQDYC